MNLLRNSFNINTVVVFFSVLVAVSTLSDKKQWEAFKNNYGKNYNSLREESVRLKIFQDRLREIENHNGRYHQGEETYMKGITQFSDLTIDEYLEKYSMPNFEPVKATKIFYARTGYNPKPLVDWREKGAVLDVENQGKCGGCYAFSTVGALEGQNAIIQNKKIPLSPQDIIDCSQSYGNFGCNGGFVQHGFNYVKDHGVAALSDYPYTESGSKCRRSEVSRVNLTVTGWVTIDKNEKALKEAVDTIGPVSLAFYGGVLMDYKKGIINIPFCSHMQTHAVLAVGYGTENGTDYWLVKNSYGKEFGEDGYFRIARNRNNMCGICDNAVYPLVE